MAPQNRHPEKLKIRGCAFFIFVVRRMLDVEIFLYSPTSESYVFQHSC